MTVGVEQKLCPLRFMFLIRPESEETCRSAIQIAYTLWGGTSAPIITFYDDLPVEYRREFGINIPTKQYYINTINNFDPDIILYDGHLDIEKIQTIAVERSCLEMDLYLASLLEKNYNHAVSINEVSSFLIEKEFKYVRTDKLKVSLPEIEEPDLLLEILEGTLPKQTAGELKDLFSSKSAFQEKKISWKSISVREENEIDINLLSNLQIKYWTNTDLLGHPPIVAYILRRDRTQDLLNFWNLRAAGWYVFPLPIDLPNLEYHKVQMQLLYGYIASTAKSQFATVSYLPGYEISEAQYNLVIENTKPDLTTFSTEMHPSIQVWYPRFWATDDILESDRIRSSTPLFDTQFKHYNLEDGRLTFQIGNLPFELKRRNLRAAVYKVILTFSPHDNLAEYAAVMTGITTTQLRQLINPIGHRSLRFSKYGIHQSVSNNDEHFHCHLAPAFKYFRAFFSNCGYNAFESSNSKLAKQVLKNLGGVEQTVTHLTDQNLKVIELFEGGNELLAETLIAKIKKHITNINNKVKDHIDRLLKDRVIEFGAKIKCSICEQRGFFIPSHLGEQLTCPICRNQFNLPTSSPKEICWAYRGIGPFSRTNKADGVLAVFATLAMFHEQIANSMSGISSAMGIELQKKDSPDKSTMEIDLILQIRHSKLGVPETFFCECKTYKKLEWKDIERLISLGDAFPGAILTIATLNESLDEVEVAMVTKLVKHFQTGSQQRPRNHVLILTGSELLAIYDSPSWDSYQDDLLPMQRYGDYIGSLCEKTIKKHLKIETWSEIMHKKWRA